MASSNRSGETSHIVDVPRAESLRQRGDEAWERRAVRQADGRVVAVAEAVETAVSLYRQARQRDPGDLDLRARLLEALVFRGEHGAEGEKARRERFTLAKETAVEDLDWLAGAAEELAGLDDLEPAERARRLLQAGRWSATELAGLHFWAAVAWGQWGDTVGRLKAARSGVAGRLRDLAETALALDETYAGAGPHRFLGRLHAEAPKVPFFTGWVDRDQALSHLERACDLAPQEPENRLFLAEAILDHADERAAEARDLLGELAGREPRPENLLGDTLALERARERLAELDE